MRWPGSWSSKELQITNEELVRDGLSRLRSSGAFLYMTYDGGFHQAGLEVDSKFIQSLINPADQSKSRGDFMMQ
jgi:hypothetical protein